MKIKRIKIAGFKSIAELSLDNVAPYSVFAGPNGAGKSNLVDALTFVQAVIELGANKAVRKFGGYEHIQCRKLEGEKATTFEFSIDGELDGKKISYLLKINGMDKDATLDEDLQVDAETLIQRRKGENNTWNNSTQKATQYVGLPMDFSALFLLQKQTKLYEFLANIRLFRFDPLGSKEPSASSADAIDLHSQGHNVAAVLAGLQGNPLFSSDIQDWIGLLVPGVDAVTTEKQRLDGRTVITFKEAGTPQPFPANMISEGTIFALCVMTAVLTRSDSPGLTLIEEPERGIHPKAIAELVKLMRDNATTTHPFFVSTHSESVVRASNVDELWLVNKLDGRTQAKNAALHGGTPGTIPLDTAWLMNFFDGGLPW